LFNLSDNNYILQLLLLMNVNNMYHQVRQFLFRQFDFYSWIFDQSFSIHICFENVLMTDE